MHTKLQIPEIKVHADDLRKLSEEQYNKVMSALGPVKAEELRYTWPFWARPEQLEPEGDWTVWVA